MKDSHKNFIIETAIKEYRNSTLYGFSLTTVRAINMMEEAYYMCSPYNVQGIAELRELIKEAKEKYGEKLYL